MNIKKYLACLILTFSLLYGAGINPDKTYEASKQKQQAVAIEIGIEAKTSKASVAGNPAMMLFYFDIVDGAVGITRLPEPPTKRHKTQLRDFVGKKSGLSCLFFTSGKCDARESE
ncbi:hypothetical protein P7H06_12860 [Paenibacillus larvae]|nr:hypothetical protein [Paenibacillus larvae]MDT2257833.1 hypothetical protein [Paenibacillus larvae]MDT2260225.1 hypothetical protein [Paenibacillus larvae]